jgi:hypothetical protein
LSPDVVLVIEVLGVLLGMVLSLLAVDEVETLGLDQLVDLSTSEPDEELLGELMADGLALLPLAVLKELEGTEGCGAGKGLVAEAGLVLLEVIAVDLVVGFLRISCGGARSARDGGGRGRGDAYPIRKAS